MTEYEFSLHISTEEYRKFYAGAVQHVQVRSRCGTVIRFPAAKLRPFLLPEGIHGVFRLRLGSNNKMLSLDRIT